MGVTEFVFELLKRKANIKGVFDRLHCCYGNFSSQKYCYNMFTDDWLFLLCQWSAADME